MTQIKVTQPFGFEQVGTIIDLDVKDAIAKVEAGFAEFVNTITPQAEPVVEGAVKTVETDAEVDAAKEVEPVVQEVATVVAQTEGGAGQQG